MKRHRRWILTRIAGMMVVLALLAACGQVQPPQMPGAPLALPLSGAIEQAPGKLLFDQSGAWWTYEPSTEEKQELHILPEEAFPAAPAVSPDGKLVAYSVFSYGKGVDDAAYGTDLHIMPADGSESRVLLAHEEAAETFTEPAWSPDGSMIYFTRRSPMGDSRIERMRLDGSERAVIVENAQHPTLSADGHHLVYIDVSNPSQGTKLMIAGADGTRPQPLLQEEIFQMLGAPRFSPTSDQLVFAAVPLNAASPAAAKVRRWSLLDWAQPRAVLAHGVPWDLWLVNLDGTNLRQLTKIQEDNPIPTWSPDGAWIGFKGEMGLYIVDVAEGQVRRVADDRSISIAWLP